MMPRKYRNLSSHTFRTEVLENALVSACNGNLKIKHQLELRAFALLLKCDAEIKKQGVTKHKYVEPLKALANFKANLQRRKKTSDPYNRAERPIPLEELFFRQ